MFTHLISLSVGTKDAEVWHQTYQELSELAANLGAVHDYVTVSSALVGGDDDVETEDELYHDEETLTKVHAAIGKALLANTDEAHPDWITDIITEIQNAGILFRERR